MMRLVLVLMSGLLLTFRWPAVAQNLAEPRVVQVETAAGITLVGDFYVPAQITPVSRFPTILIFHQIGSNRAAAAPLANVLTDAGYAVLAVDAPGAGESGGAWVSDYASIVGNIRVWVDWLLSQPDVRTDGIALLGSSVGGLQAIIGCAAIPECVTAIALSPPGEGYGITAEQMRAAVETQLRTRSILLLAATFDGVYTAAVRELVAWSRGEISADVYRGYAHGEALFLSFDGADRVIARILDWLNEQVGVIPVFYERSNRPVERLG